MQLNENEVFETLFYTVSYSAVWRRFTASLMYYALSLNAGRLPGNIFVNMFLLAFVEIPANLIAVPLLERVGRRLTLSVSMLLAGISSVLMIPFMFIPGQWLRLLVGDTLIQVLTHYLLCNNLLSYPWLSSRDMTSSADPGEVNRTYPVYSVRPRPSYSYFIAVLIWCLDQAEMRIFNSIFLYRQIMTSLDTTAWYFSLENH